jgi:hypothetical protein
MNPGRHSSIWRMQNDFKHLMGLGLAGAKRHGVYRHYQRTEDLSTLQSQGTMRMRRGSDSLRQGNIREQITHH